MLVECSIGRCHSMMLMSSAVLPSVRSSPACCAMQSAAAAFCMAPWPLCCACALPVGAPVLSCPRCLVRASLPSRLSSRPHAHSWWAMLTGVMHCASCCHVDFCMAPQSFARSTSAVAYFGCHCIVFGCSPVLRCLCAADFVQSCKVQCTSRGFQHLCVFVC